MMRNTHRERCRSPNTFEEKHLIQKVLLQFYPTFNPSLPSRSLCRHPGSLCHFILNIQILSPPAPGYAYSVNCGNPGPLSLLILSNPASPPFVQWTTILKLNICEDNKTSGTSCYVCPLLQGMTPDTCPLSQNMTILYAKLLSPNSNSNSYHLHDLEKVV